MNQLLNLFLKIKMRFKFNQLVNVQSSRNGRNKKLKNRFANILSFRIVFFDIYCQIGFGFMSMQGTSFLSHIFLKNKIWIYGCGQRLPFFSYLEVNDRRLEARQSCPMDIFLITYFAYSLSSWEGRESISKDEGSKGFINRTDSIRRSIYGQAKGTENSKRLYRFGAPSASIHK